jgi:predicted Rossmann-fold nucleotide-binding protein
MEQLKDEERIRKAFKEKDWAEIKSADSWVIFKVIGRFPIVLVGKSYWAGLLDWIKATMLASFENINKEDLDLFALVDTTDEAVAVIDEFYSKYLLSPNY